MFFSHSILFTFLGYLIAASASTHPHLTDSVIAGKLKPITEQAGELGENCMSMMFDDPKKSSQVLINSTPQYTDNSLRTFADGAANAMSDQVKKEAITRVREVISELKAIRALDADIRQNDQQAQRRQNVDRNLLLAEKLAARLETKSYFLVWMIVLIGSALIICVSSLLCFWRPSYA